MKVIWRDTVDESYYHFGVELYGGKYTIWFSLLEDGIHDMFGKDVAKKITSLKPGQTYEVELSMEML